MFGPFSFCFFQKQTHSFDTFFHCVTSYPCELFASKKISFSLISPNYVVQVEVFVEVVKLYMFIFVMSGQKKTFLYTKLLISRKSCDSFSCPMFFLQFLFSFRSEFFLLFASVLI